MWHPLDSLRLPWRVLAIVILVVALIGIFSVLQFYSGQIRGQRKQRDGIIQFELAGSAEAAQRIVKSWEVARVVNKARCSLYLDFWFIVCYTVLFSYAWTWAARQFCGLREQLVRLNCVRVSRVPSACMVVAMLLALGIWVAGLLDVIENCSLLYMLENRVSDPWPQVARVAATLKFSLMLMPTMLASSLPENLVLVVWGSIAVLFGGLYRCFKVKCLRLSAGHQSV